MSEKTELPEGKQGQRGISGQHKVQATRAKAQKKKKKQPGTCREPKANWYGWSLMKREQQETVRKVGRGQITMSSAGHSKKLRFHPVGVNLKREHKLHFKEISLEDTGGSKVTAMVQATDDKSNERQKERKLSTTQ